MYEELSYGENLVGTAHPRIMTVNEAAMTAKEMRLVAERIGAQVTAEDQLGLIEILIKIADYHPQKAEQDATAQAQVTEIASKVKPMSRKGGQMRPV